MTRPILLLALCLVGASAPAFAQTALIRRQPGAEATLRGSVPARDAEVEAARRRQEDRLRDREDKARRTLKGICTGC